MAQCAVCMGEIGPRDLVAQGTEAFHRRCLPNSNRSILTRFRIALQEARAKLERVQRQSADDRRDAANARVQNMNLESDLQIARSRLRTAEAAVKTEHEMLEAERARNRKDREDAAMAMRRQAELLRENDQLRNELQVHRALGPAPAHVPADGNATPADAGKDPLEIRASLLELD